MARFLRRVFRVSLALPVSMFVACRSDLATVSPSPTPQIASYLSGAAASALQSNGQFAPDGGESPDGSPMISASRAQVLAMAYLRLAGRTYHAMWERQRGAPIDLSTLSVGSRVYFAHTPYGAFPPGFHPALRKTYGPYYLVTLLSAGEPVIVMAVSAYNTDVVIDSKGQLILPAFGGMEFEHEGLPVNGASYRPQSPEEAVATLASESHTRIVTVPKLMMRGSDISPSLAVWQMDIERDVPVIRKDNGRAVQTHTPLVSPLGRARFLRAEDSQSASEAGQAKTFTAAGGIGPVRPYEVPIQPGRATKHAVVTFAKGG